jgi:acyl carrier protein
MNNTDKLINIFKSSFSIIDEDVKNIRFNEHTSWDSVGHMMLISELEKDFEIQISNEDLVEIVSYETSLEVLKNYGISFV